MQNNFLQIGEEWHCLYCHFTFKHEKEDVIEHSKKHTNSKTQPCKDLEKLLDCPDWANKFN